jgi:hypothetical protein
VFETTRLATGTAPETESGMRACLIALLASGCIVIEDDDPPGSPSPDPDPPGALDILLTDDCPGDQVQVVTTAERVGRSGRIELGYSGCGRAEALYACFDGAFQESFPVGARVLVHNAPAGDCDAWITEEVTFSLATVIERHVESYGDEGPFGVTFAGAGDSAGFLFEP